jgi:cytochrome d ubiquinol oxidase subunit II
MQLFWFSVIALLWAGFFVLEGFGLGVCALLPIVGRTDARRTAIIQTMAPSWDGNEGWLLVAGGATFFAFRGWFDGMLSGFTLLFVGVFGALIVRAIALRARAHMSTPRGRQACDAVAFAGSAGTAALLGVVVANFLRGVDLDGHGNVRAGLGTLFSPYALLGAAAVLMLFALLGAVFLGMRTTGPTHRATRRLVFGLAPLTGAGVVAFVIWSETMRGGVVSMIFGGLAMGGLAFAISRALLDQSKRAFGLLALTTLLLPLWAFSAMWPDVLPARTDPALGLTVHNTAASSGAMIVLTVVGVELGAVLLVYLTWSYWIFHARVTGKNAVEPRVRTLAAAPASNGNGRRSERAVLTRLVIAPHVRELGRPMSQSEV